MKLQDKVALVTGASRGIGRAIVNALGQEGAIVIGTATSEKGAESITHYIAEQGFKGCGKILSVNDNNAIDSLIKEIVETFSPINILVNNAGITDDSLLMRMKPEQWDQVIDTNLSSVYRLSKAVLRDMMKARYGRIINLTSVVGIMGNAGQTNYAATKAGIIGFSKSLAREVGSRGITVNCVAPGFVQTDMTASLPEEQKKSLTEQIPLATLGKPEDIADVVVFLACAGYITGETININGGMYMV
ncbi:MAG: 3-oxoacyl-ACP reductase FabG [Cardiobacteriaceae bacterium]|nr:3-oxoacyl-ACP reductase FabG [Cardiobacteriaceae bacterium]